MDALDDEMCGFVTPHFFNVIRWLELPDSTPSQPRAWDKLLAGSALSCAGLVGYLKERFDEYFVKACDFLLAENYPTLESAAAVTFEEADAVLRRHQVTGGLSPEQRKRQFEAHLAMLAESGGTYPIGTPRKPWGVAEKAEWVSTRKVVRSYGEEVLTKIEALKERFDVENYGSLSHDPERYPLFSVRSKDWSPNKPSVLITGGVHGYETSGVQGALLFLETEAEQYAQTFNIIVAPCVSPWGYETIQRWNAQAVDPNRSFNPNGEVVPGRKYNPEAATENSTALIAFLDSLCVEQWMCHIDLHETTDSDETEFMPAKAARDGVEYKG